jgi:hypothetical protein
MAAQKPAAQIVLTPKSYSVDIAGESVDLPLVAINDTLAISLLMVIDMGVRFGERVGKALARLSPANLQISSSVPRRSVFPWQSRCLVIWS